MTALDQFDRLETLGLWRIGPHDPGCEVIVKFGKSTLVIEAGADAPIAHWSLAALHRVESTDTADTFKVGDETSESLRIEDQMMREAIAKVMPHGRTGDPNVRRRSFLVPLLTTLLVVLAVVFLLPLGLHKIVVTLISPEQADRIAQEMLPKIEERTGPSCTNRAGKQAIDIIARRLATDGPVSISVMDMGERRVLGLPGRHVVLNASTVETAVSEMEIAGWAALGLSEPDPGTALDSLFEDGLNRDTLMFLASGQVTDRAYERGVNRLLISSSEIGAPDPARTSALLEAAGIPASPLVAALRRNDITLQITGSSKSAQPVLTDQQWVALQQICD